MILHSIQIGTSGFVHYAQLGRVVWWVALSGSQWLSDRRRGRGGVSCRGRGGSGRTGALVTSQGLCGQGRAYTLVRVRVRVCVWGRGWLSVGRSVVGWGWWVGWSVVLSWGRCGGAVGCCRRGAGCRGRGGCCRGLWAGSAGTSTAGVKDHFTLAQGLLLAHAPLAQDSVEHSPRKSVT